MPVIRYTLPYEDRNIKAGECVMIHEPNGKEHYVTNVEYDYRTGPTDKVVTIVELVPYDEFDGTHRSRLDANAGE